MADDDSLPELGPGYWVAGPCGACSEADVQCMERMNRCIHKFAVIDRIYIALLLLLVAVVIVVAIGGT